MWEKITKLEIYQKISHKIVLDLRFKPSTSFVVLRATRQKAENELPD